MCVCTLLTAISLSPSKSILYNIFKVLKCFKCLRVTTTTISTMRINIFNLN